LHFRGKGMLNARFRRGLIRQVNRGVIGWQGRAKSPPKTVVVILFVLLFHLIPNAEQADAAKEDFAIASGHFYTQTGVKGERGFSITDDDNIPFWQEFRRLGGVIVLGYPISWRYAADDGSVYQATQAALLQWSPQSKRVTLANIFEMFPLAGKEAFLAAKGIPGAMAGYCGDQCGETSEAVRLGWLTNEAIRAFFYANPNPNQIQYWGLDSAIAFYGLPMSQPLNVGPYIIQRFQRAALQLWTDRVPNMPEPGTVVRVLAGDWAREAGLVPWYSSQPLPLEDSNQNIDPSLRPALEILKESARDLPEMRSLSEHGVAIGFAPLEDGVVAHFLSHQLAIEVNLRWRNSDPRALAAVLTHEATHVADYFAGTKGDSPQDCFDSEQRAFFNEAVFWRNLFGQQGKQPPVDDLDRQLNFLVERIADPASFAEQLTVLYKQQCGTQPRS